MSDKTQDCKTLAKAYNVEFKDFGNGHVQFSGRGVVVSYWPFSKKRTVHCLSNGRKEFHCSPYDAIRICLQGNSGGGLKTKAKITKNPPQVRLEPIKTNPAGLKHFYDGDVPPWDKSLEYKHVMTESDAVRMQAYQIQSRCEAARWVADEMDRVA